jgi:hypothetical protein
MQVYMSQDPFAPFLGGAGSEFPYLGPRSDVSPPAALSQDRYTDEFFLADLAESLPLCGFGNYTRACRNPVSDPYPDNRFLFRVWREDPTGEIVVLQEDLGFVAQAFKRDGITVAELKAQIASYAASYDLTPLVVKRVLNDEDPPSPFIPTTLSFVWAYWWATRVALSRKWDADPHKIFISVIQSRDLDADSVWMPLQHCRNPDESLAREFADTAQEVLILGHIPAPVVLVTLNFGRLRESGLVPDWMRAPLMPTMMGQRSSFRMQAEHCVGQFCMQPPQHRLLMTWTQASRLWEAVFREHGTSSRDLPGAIHALALHLARWPYRSHTLEVQLHAWSMRMQMKSLYALAAEY